MTELNDHLKLLFARAAQLFDARPRCAVRHDTPETIYAELMARTRRRDDPRLVVTFPVELPAGTTAEEIEQWLAASGFTRVQAEREVATPTGPRKVLDVVADRFRIQAHREGARDRGDRGRAQARQRAASTSTCSRRRSERRAGRCAPPSRCRRLWNFSTGLHCPDSDIRYADPHAVDVLVQLGRAAPARPAAASAA